MGLFSKILEKLGLKKDQDEDDKPATGVASHIPRKPSATATNPKATAPAKPAASQPAMGTSTRTTMPSQGAKDDIPRQPGGRAATVAPPPKAMSEVDVKAMLEEKAKGTGLNWKQSISDLLFLLDAQRSRNEIELLYAQSLLDYRLSQERLAAELRRNLQLRKAQGRARRAGEPDLAEGLPAARDDGGSTARLGDDGEKPS